MKVYCDSSAFAKRFVEENGSDAIEAICSEAAELGLCVFCVPEIISALNRRRREHLLSHAQYEKVKHRLIGDVCDADIINITPAVVGVSISVLEQSPVRTLDALHIACALEWDADLFVSSDKQQCAAAKRAGLNTRPV